MKKQPVVDEGKIYSLTDRVRVRGESENPQKSTSETTDHTMQFTHKCIQIQPQSIEIHNSFQ